jgi:Xaa-Pro aminopeptidase
MTRNRPSIPASRYAERLVAARGLAERAGLDAILVGVGADLRYLAGYPAMPLERLTMLVIPARGATSLVVPRLEATPARGCPGRAGDLPVVTWEEGDDAHAAVAAMVVPGAGPASVRGRRIAVSDDLPARHLLPLQRHLQGAEFSLASAVLRELRMIKDPDEIALLTLAAHAADRVVAQIAAGVCGPHGGRGGRRGSSAAHRRGS